MKTYPCIIGNRIVELTDEQRDALAWKKMPIEEKIAVILQRIENLESIQKTAMNTSEELCRLQSANQELVEACERLLSWDYFHEASGIPALDAVFVRAAIAKATK